MGRPSHRRERREERSAQSARIELSVSAFSANPGALCGRKVGLALLALVIAGPLQAQAPLAARKIGELDLSILGVSATVEPPNPVVPKNTASGVRIVVRAGDDELSLADVTRFLGAGFEVQGELSGPGLATTITIPQRTSADPLPADPLLLPLPGLPVAGDYNLTNLRIVSGGRSVLEVDPSRVVVQVIDQILVTSVTTRPLTLDEIRERGIDLSSGDNYLGFAFTLGLLLESQAVTITLPVVFDRQGNVVPEPLLPLPAPPRVAGVQLPPMPTIVPFLLEAEGPAGGGPPPSLSLPGGSGEARIPSLLVIPGNVGYLKQFFSAQLFVANGAPVGSGLVVKNVFGKIRLPLGPDGVRGTNPDSNNENDDPLSLPDLLRDGQSVPHPEELPVVGPGPDGTPGTSDDVGAFAPAEQGLADFSIRGDREGFHTIDFDIRADLEGLPVGPVKVKGKASGGVLVRNPYFDLSFTAPSVVRTDEKFRLFVTVTNIGQGAANLLSLKWDNDALSGLELAPGETGERQIDTLSPGDATTFDFEFLSLRTGQVVASYLRFDTDAPDGTRGDLRFKVGIGERGVPLSPDTLVLPTSVDLLPDDVVRAAMRVLGQAWSVANAPAGTLPPGVLRTSRSVVTQKALALAEAGLRVRLGQDALDAVRDLAYDFWSGTQGPDPGFDQLLRTTEAGRALAVAIGAALADRAAAPGSGPLGYEQELSRLLASGSDFLAFAVVDGTSGARVHVTVQDGAGRRTLTAASPGQLPRADVPGAVLIPLGPPSSAPLLGLLTAPTESLYVIELTPITDGPVDFSLTWPGGDGTVRRGSIQGLELKAGERAWVRLDRQQPDLLRLHHDLDGDGLPEQAYDLAADPTVRFPEGPGLVSARIVGPETLDGASPFGVYVAFLFDRVVDAASAAVSGNYQVPSNQVQSARRQLSGRLVFASLDQPEGNYLPAQVTVDGIADGRGTPMPSAATVELLSLVEDPGAVVTGRVINGDGSPLLPGVIVTYLNNKNLSCLGPVVGPISALPVDAAGQFEFRYVRQDNCGRPFELVTQDPTTGAVRKVSAFVRGPGERIVLDIALFAKGSVVGQVTRFVSAQSQDTVPAPGVQVVAVSVTDPQSGGAATTDGDGRYEIDGITVGAVNVRAGGTSGVGGGSGVIQRPGQPAVVNILLDDDAARIHGTVRKIDLNEPDPARQVSAVPGLQVLYYLGNTLLAATNTDASGSYAFDDVPAGVFTVKAALNTRDRGSFGPATASKGDDVRADINLEIPRDDSPGLGTVRGQVFFADGTPAGDVIVSVNERAVLSVKDEQAGGPPVGAFEIPGVPVRTGLVVVARTRDGKRSAFRSFVFPPEPNPAVTVNLTLSDLGDAHFTVLDAAGLRLPRHQVFLQGICVNPCGCAVAETGPSGEPAVFRDLPVGTVYARAFRPGTGFMDVASASATVRGSAPGQEGRGTLPFAGTGSVFGTVYDPPQTPGGPPVPSHGAEVTLTSRVFVNDGERTCDLVPGASHRTRTAQDGTFSFTAVNVGSVSLAARSDFLNKTVGAQGTILRDGQALGPFTLRFVDTIAGVLSGVVTLPDGLTPAGSGVEVTANGPLPDVTVKTNADSTYRFPELLPEGGYTITAREAQTGLVARGQVYLRAGQDASYPMRLEGRGAVRVRVVDGADEPVSQAVVKLKETDFPGNSYDGLLSPASDGAVTFANVFEGGVSVEVSDAFGRGGRGSGIVPTPGPDSVPVEIKVRITTTGSVTGRFLMPAPAGAEGPPIPFGTVRLVAGGRTIGETTTRNAPDPGRFDFSYVPAGDIRLEAQDPLTARTGFSVGKVTAEGETVTLDVVAQALGSVTGTVTQNGQPVAFAQVEIVSGTFKASTFTTQDGTYRLDGVPEGRIVVTASGPGGELRGTGSGTLGEEGQVVTIDVALRATGHVHGNVVAAGGGQAPLSVVTIQVGGVGGGTQTTTTREADGFFEFPKVPAGLATLTVDALGSIDQARRTVDVPAQGTVTLIVELNGVGAIDAQVVGVPEGYTANVVINGTGGFPYQFVASPFPNPNGSFRLPEVLAGPFTASLRTSSGPLRLFGSLSSTVEPGETRAIELTVQPTGTVEGSVYRSDGKPAYGADVLITTNAGVVSGLVGPEGTFEVEGVLAGSVTARVDDRLTGGVGSASGTVPEGGTLRVPRIDLDDTPISVVSVDPPDGAGQVPLDREVRITFSDPVQGFSSGSVFVKNGVMLVSGTPALSADKRTLTLRPSSTWPDSKELTVTATTGVTDVFGRHLLQTFTSRFRTVDTSHPKVAAVVPPNGAVQVDPASAVIVTFDEPLSEATDLAGLIVLSLPGGPVGGTTLVDPPRTSATFTPAAPLLANLRYTVTVNGAVDESGNRQTQPHTTTFRTPDTLPPVLTLVSPANGSWVKTPRPAFNISMTDGAVGLGVAAATARLFVDGAEVGAAKSATAITFTPSADLAQGPHVFSAEARDLVGNLGTLGVPDPLTFSVDSVPPEPAVLTGVAPGVVQGTVRVGGSASDSGSGVARIDFLRDGAVFASAAAPPFEVDFNTAGLPDGPYALSARATDVAGNAGPAGAPVAVLVDNRPLTVTITSPASGARFRDSLLARASVSEAVDHLDFTIGAQTLPGVKVGPASYEAIFGLASVAEGTVRVTAAAFALVPPDASASVDVEVDLTPPSAPDPGRIEAEPPVDGFSLVFGRAGALDVAAHTARVEIRNPSRAALAVATPQADGSFTASIAAAADDPLSLVAIDDLGNVSLSSTVVVRRTPSLPPSEGTTSLRFEGVLVDRVGPGAAALAPDGSLDAVFTVSLAIGDGVTRTLSYVDLAGPVTRSTRPAVGSALGVATDPGAPLLNGADGQVGFPVTTGATLTLFAADAGFIQPGATYTVTAAFTDGSRFVGTFTLVAPEDRTQVAHSVAITAAPPTVLVSGGTPGTAVLTLTDVRDLEGTLVPDGTKLAIAVADMASKDPRGGAIRSAGGRILDGEAAANNAAFRVFTVAGGAVVATYSTDPVTPAALTGAQVVVQVQAADEAGNVLGTEAIGTYELNVRSSADQGVLTVEPSSLYADKADRRSQVRIEVRDASGSPVPDGTRVVVSAASCAGTNASNACIGSAGGQILGGEASPTGAQYRAFTVTGGVVAAEYSTSGLSVGVGLAPTAVVQVMPADAAGARTSSRVLGTAAVVVTGPSSSEIALSPRSVPLVFPARPVQVRLHHVHDTRANLVPDGAVFLLSPNSCATVNVNNACIGSVGGQVQGLASPAGNGFKMFSLTLGEVAAVYTVDGVTGSPGQELTASLQVAMGDPAGNRLDNRAVAVGALKVVTPTNAVGAADPPSLLADGALHTSTVTFDPVLDAFGNPLPDGAKVVVSAGSCAAVTSSNACIFSAGGQVVNGEASPTGAQYKVLTVGGGAVTALYGNQGIAFGPGQTQPANVVVLEAGPAGERLSSRAVGVVPVNLAGLTSASGAASPPVLHADGSDRRSVVTLTDLRDAAGQLVPDGTRVAVSAASCAGVTSTNACIGSFGGQIVGGEASPSGTQYRVFDVQNGQVVFEYSAQGVPVATGEQTARVVALAATPAGARISSRAVATVPVVLVAPASAVVAAQPADVFADGGERLAQLTLSDLVDEGGTPIPDGALVGLTAAHCGAVDPQTNGCIVSTGGQILSAGTTAGDGVPAANNANYRVFTVAGGEVRAVYSAQGLTAGVGASSLVNVAAAHANTSGAMITTRAFAVGTLRLRGMTSAMADGPTSLGAGGQTGTVTFSGIKDSAGNTVPDGAQVVVTAANCGTVDPVSNGCIGSSGGTIVDGAPSPSGAQYKAFTVSNGSVVVTYSTGSSAGTARVQIAPARPDGSIIGNKSLIGGTWVIAVTN